MAGRVVEPPAGERVRLSSLTFAWGDRGRTPRRRLVLLRGRTALTVAQSSGDCGRADPDPARRPGRDVSAGSLRDFPMPCCGCSLPPPIVLLLGCGRTFAYCTFRADGVARDLLTSTGTWVCYRGNGQGIIIGAFTMEAMGRRSAGPDDRGSRCSWAPGVRAIGLSRFLPLSMVLVARSRAWLIVFRTTSSPAPALAPPDARTRAVDLSNRVLGHLPVGGIWVPRDRIGTPTMLSRSRDP